MHAATEALNTVPPLPKASRWRALGRELPLWAGMVLGLGALWWRGHAFVLDRDLRGYHWPEYLVQAWRIREGTFDTDAGFRKSLYPAVLQAIGEVVGYADAAVILGSIGAALCVVSAGLLARSLADAPTGGLAALGVGLVPLVAQSSHWATSYPVSAGTIGLGLAASAAFARWPSGRTALLPGLCTGLALAVDDRGALVVPMAAMGVVLGVVRGRGAAWLAVPVLVLSPLLPAGLEQLLGYVPELFGGVGGRLDAQRAVASRWAQISGRPGLQLPCADTPVHAWMRPSFFPSACGQAVLMDNRAWALPRALGVPLAWVWVGLLGWWVPWPKRERWVSAAAVLGAIVGPVVLFAALTPLPARYLVQLVVPLGVVLPVGLARVCARLPRPVWWTVAVAMAVGLTQASPDAVGTLGLGDIGEWSPDAWVGDHDALRAQLQDGDVVLDCSDHGAAVALLPHHVVPGSNLLEADVGLCQGWAQGTVAVPSGAWILTDPTRGLGVAGTHNRVVVHALVNDGVWEARVRRRGFVAWRARSPPVSAP